MKAGTLWGQTDHDQNRSACRSRQRSDRAWPASEAEMEEVDDPGHLGRPHWGLRALYDGYHSRRHRPQ